MFLKERKFLEGEKPINYTMTISCIHCSDLVGELIEFIEQMVLEGNNPYDYKMYSELLVMYYYTDLIKEKNIVDGFRGTYHTYLKKGYLSFLNDDYIPEQAKEVLKIGKKAMEEIYYATLKQRNILKMTPRDKELLEFITKEENKSILDALNKYSEKE